VCAAQVISASEDRTVRVWVPGRAEAALTVTREWLGGGGATEPGPARASSLGGARRMSGGGAAAQPFGERRRGSGGSRGGVAAAAAAAAASGGGGMLLGGGGGGGGVTPFVGGLSWAQFFHRDRLMLAAAGATLCLCAYSLGPAASTHGVAASVAATAAAARGRHGTVA
jgi:hypothetical protein